MSPLPNERKRPAQPVKTQAWARAEKRRKKAEASRKSAAKKKEADES